jgi:photosystem II stability/assembly factor-like uncharacterized protein
MRRILFFALIITGYISCSKSNSNNPAPPTGGLDTLYNWVKGNPAGAELDDVWFIDNKNGFVLSASSIYASTDSGNTWSAVPNTSSFKVFNIQFLDNLQGYVQGTNQLGITKDGGKTWTLKSIASGNAFTSQFLYPATGYYNDYNKGIYKTTDTGTTWNLILNGAGKGPNFIFYFLDSLNGFSMVDANCSKTVDGGVSWQLVASNITDSNFTTYYKMHFTDTLNGYCGTPKGLFKTADGGKSWNNTLPVETTFMVPYFFDKNNGYCMAANIMYKTTNGGTSWSVSCKLGKDDFSGMHFLDMNTGWATTFGGYVLRLKP